MITHKHHIIPLNGKNVSGLHTISNLQCGLGGTGGRNALVVVALLALFFALCGLSSSYAPPILQADGYIQEM